MYGFAAERLDYHIRSVEIPIISVLRWTAFRIAQSKRYSFEWIHAALQVRRAVHMANELGADLAVVTGDFITGASDPTGGLH